MQLFSLLRRNRRAAGLIVLVAIVAIAIVAASLIPAPVQAGVESAPASPSVLQYVLIGWNDLGMHCMNLLFKDLAVLPPFNTVWAQVVQKGDPPQIVTSGITVSYSIRNNTYSAGKTDFWTYVLPLFGVSLPPNIGLTGKGLAGDMDPATDHFIAAGIPVTPFLDNNLTQLYPYNLGDLVARDSGNNIIATTTAVVPVSTEMHCERCHGKGKDPGGPYANVYANILHQHDDEEGTNLINQRPVLCAKCHADNALGAPGVPGVENLSLAMHKHHAEDLLGMADITSSTMCYNCHPGTQTQCLRDIMYKKGLTCTNCHGNLMQMANPNRNPWVDVPRCGNCHAAQYAENAGLRYRDSTGHGGLYCEACHNSTHAIVPTVQPNDNIQNIALQGKAGALQKCTVCHLTMPTDPGPHGLIMPTVPVLLRPVNGATRTMPTVLTWSPVNGATSYRVQVRLGSATGAVVASGAPTAASFTTPTLTGGRVYYWRVRGCDQKLCGDWSGYRYFKSAVVAGAPAALEDRTVE